MRHLQSKKVTNESMFGYALAHAKDDFMFFGGNKSRFEVLCIQFTELPKEAALGKNSSNLKQGLRLAFSTGIVGLVSYDDYSSQKSAETSRFFEVQESVVFDKKNALRYHFLEPGFEARFDEGTYEKSYEEILAKI